MSAQLDTLWVDAPGGYQVAYANGTIICRNPRGRVLRTLPSALRDCDIVEELKQITLKLAEHERTCLRSVEHWMLHALPVPTRILTSVWSDPAWRHALQNAIVAPFDGDQVRLERAGFLHMADEDQGLELIGDDGLATWHDADMILIPHPTQLLDPARMKAIAFELGLDQGLLQLLREVYRMDSVHHCGQYTIEDFAEGRFTRLADLHQRCELLGFRIHGGFAICPVWEDERLIVARYWIGSDGPDQETYTGELLWVDEQEMPLRIVDVGPVALSEGLRMARSLYAGRSHDSDHLRLL
jgi:hypothetical protein